MKARSVVEKHLETPKHLKRVREENALQLQAHSQTLEARENLDLDELPPEQTRQNIERQEDGFFWSAASGAGPMTTTLTVERHLTTVKHAREQET